MSEVNSMKWRMQNQLWSLPQSPVFTGTRKRSYFSNLSHEEGRGYEKKTIFTMSKSYPSRDTLKPMLDTSFCAGHPRVHARYPRVISDTLIHTGQSQVVPDALNPQQMSPGSMLDTLGPPEAPWIHARHPQIHNRCLNIEVSLLESVQNRYILKNSL